MYAFKTCCGRMPNCRRGKGRPQPEWEPQVAPKTTWSLNVEDVKKDSNGTHGHHVPFFSQRGGAQCDQKFKQDGNDCCILLLPLSIEKTLKFEPWFTQRQTVAGCCWYGWHSSMGSNYFSVIFQMFVWFFLASQIAVKSHQRHTLLKAWGSFATWNITLHTAG